MDNLSIKKFFQKDNKPRLTEEQKKLLASTDHRQVEDIWDVSEEYINKYTNSTEPLRLTSDMRVLFNDDHELFRLAIVNLLEEIGVNYSLKEGKEFEKLPTFNEVVDFIYSSVYKNQDYWTKFGEENEDDRHFMENLPTISFPKQK